MFKLVQKIAKQPKQHNKQIRKNNTPTPKLKIKVFPNVTITKWLDKDIALRGRHVPKISSCLKN